MHPPYSFSALQRAEIAEMLEDFWSKIVGWCFSALQRAEIAEMPTSAVQFGTVSRFSALQRAEIAEIRRRRADRVTAEEFQCSSTSRNC